MHGSGLDNKTQVDIPVHFKVFTDIFRGSFSGIGRVLIWWLNRPSLAVCMCPIHNVLVHLRPEKTWIRVFLHEAEHFGLDLVEAVRSGI